MSIGSKLSEPEIITFPETKLIGMCQSMSFAQNSTSKLWGAFMPERREIQSTDENLFSLQLYPPGFFERFDPNALFEKWAAVAVNNFDTVPDGMAKRIIPEGRYAVFHYKGNPADGAAVFRYILGEWLLQSGYVLDNRPHFEILGNRYKKDSDDSEEDICIPVI